MSFLCTSDVNLAEGHDIRAAISYPGPPSFTVKSKFSTFGRVTTLSGGTPSNDMRARTFMRTIRSIGEASRKSSSREVRKSSDGLVEKSKDTMFGKMKGANDGDHDDLE